ncbi:MAG: Restriction endonuclease, partial [Pelotomaculum thermopropionicum]
MHEEILQKTITNEYLGLTKIITGSYPAEITVKAAAQAARWADREKRARERKDLDFLRELAAYDTRQAETFIKEAKNILRANLERIKKFDPASLYDDRPYPPFVFKEAAPRYKTIARATGVPQKSFFGELFFPSVRRKRLKLEKEASQAYETAMRQYEERKTAARGGHEKERAVHLEAQSVYNRSVDQLQLDFERGRPEAVESCVRIALSGLTCPDLMELDFDARFLPAEGLVAVNCIFPCPWEIPRAVRYRYNETEHGVTPVEMEPEEFALFYKTVLLQLTLSSIHTVFKSVASRHIRQAAFNGLVNGPVPLDRDNGTEDGTEGASIYCILTCKVTRELFQSLNLEETPPEQCFTAIKGVMKEPLTGLLPVQPLVTAGKPPGPAGKTGSNRETQTATEPAAFRPGELTTLA